MVTLNIPSALRALLATAMASALQSAWPNVSSDNVWGTVADCSIAGFVPQFPAGQTQLVVPTDLQPRFIGLAFGVQNFTCSSTNTYMKMGAHAEILDLSCYVNASWFNNVQYPAYRAWTNVSRDVSIATVTFSAHVYPQTN